jgi:hypothetical protein
MMRNPSSRAALSAASVSRAFRFWLGSALAVILLGVGAQAQAQTAVTGNLNVTNYGNARTVTITLNSGNSAPGTIFDVNYTVTNATAYPLHFMESYLSADISLTPGGLTLLGDQNLPDAVKNVILQPGEFFTLSFQVEVTSAANVANARAQIYYTVGRVYDQVWNYDDFYNFCRTIPPAVVVNTSDPEFTTGIATGTGGISPDYVCRQEASFHNDLPHPVTIHYMGYTDDGTIADYISGTLCDMAHCGNEWVDGITLQPGESTGPFTMLVGMPWYIGNESMSTTGTYTFMWRLESSLAAADDSATTAPGVPVTIDALANDTLAGGPYTVTLGATSGGAWVVNGDNTVTFTPAAGFTGAATAEYTVSDGADSATATITVTVQAVATTTTPVPTLGGLALAALGLSVAGLGAWRAKRPRV